MAIEDGYIVAACLAKYFDDLPGGRVRALRRYPARPHRSGGAEGAREAGVRHSARLWRDRARWRPEKWRGMAAGAAVRERWNGSMLTTRPPLRCERPFRSARDWLTLPRRREISSNGTDSNRGRGKPDLEVSTGMSDAATQPSRKLARDMIFADRRARPVDRLRRAGARHCLRHAARDQTDRLYAALDAQYRRARTGRARAFVRRPRQHHLPARRRRFSRGRRASSPRGTSMAAPGIPMYQGFIIPRVGLAVVLRTDGAMVMLMPRGTRALRRRATRRRYSRRFGEALSAIHCRGTALRLAVPRRAARSKP